MVYLEHLSEHPLNYITEFHSSDKIRVPVCPHCHSHKQLYLHGVYHRYVIWFNNIYQIPIQRHYCVHCGKTVSILPSFCHPKFQLALPFILDLLSAFFNSLSFDYPISVQHLRFVIHRFLLNMNQLIQFFRIFYDPLIPFPVSGQEKAIKLLEMINHLGTPKVFAKRYFTHFKKGFMAH